MAACRFCLTCPEGYSLPRTPRKKFDPTIYYGPRATPEPGKPWWYLVFLGIQFPPMPTESVHHGTFLLLIAPESVCFRALPLPTCTGIGKTCHRVATGMVHCRAELPLPLSRERCGMQPIEPTESVATV